jgi:hypothetical protein
MTETWTWVANASNADLKIVVEGLPESRGRVCTIPHYEGREGLQMKRANMIAAAPEMFAVIGEALDAYDGSGLMKLTPVTLTKMVTALKKARGEA